MRVLRFKGNVDVDGDDDEGVSYSCSGDDFFVVPLKETRFECNKPIIFDLLTDCDVICGLSSSFDIIPEANIYMSKDYIF